MAKTKKTEAIPKGDFDNIIKGLLKVPPKVKRRKKKKTK